MRGFQVQSVKRVFTRLNAQPIRARTSRAAAVPLARGLGARLNVHTYCNSVKIVKQQMRCTMKRGFSTESMQEVQRMSPQTLRDILNNAEERKRFQIVDVRETAELALSKLPDEKVVHLPMSQAQQWAETVAEPDNDIIDHDKPVVCLCHHGVRSLNVAMFLKQLGFQQVYNVEGGIDAYSREADSSVPQY